MFEKRMEQKSHNQCQIGKSIKELFMVRASNSKNSDMIKLNPVQLVYVLVVLLVLVPLTISFNALDDINDSFIRYYFAPSLKKDFGFETGKAKVTFGKEEYKLFAISSVKPRSFFDKVGIKSNDIPVYIIGCKIGIGKTPEAIFYNTLLRAKKGYPISIRLINSNEYSTAFRTYAIYDEKYIHKIQLPLTY
jgi:hypothetical protein